MYLIKPVGPSFNVTQPYGPTAFTGEPPKTVAGVYYPHYHTGIDYGNGKCGDPIFAAADGNVHYSTVMSDGNNCVTIAHGGGWMTLYGHMSKRSVTQGQNVKQGQVIGYVGSTGNSTGCHLHFSAKASVTTYSFWQSGIDVDPATLMGEDNMDLRNAVPVVVADIAKGATVWANADQTNVLIPAWAGALNVGVYGQNSSMTCIRVDFATGGADLRAVWVTNANVSNLRSPQIAPPNMPGAVPPDETQRATALAALTQAQAAVKLI